MVYVTYSLLMNLTVASVALAMYSSKAMEGYPQGYLSDCPGSTKPVIITPKTLRRLAITVQGPGSVFFAQRRRYTYYQTKLLAKDPNLNFEKKTLLYVGGYMDSPNFILGQLLGQQYTALGYNVIMVDLNYFTTVYYPIACRYMRAVGKHTAEILFNLTKAGLNPKKLELIGLSLGGQTMSFIAKNYRLQTGMNISRLTALDPAGPCFRHLGPEDRLDQSDADFVDVIITNAEGFGMAAPVGHVNFYVNGGEYQYGEIFWFPCITLCSHVRSYTLWLAALENTDSFIAMKCDSVQDARERNCFDRKPQVTNVLGVNTDRTKQGVYYLGTYNNFPYYMGKEGLLKNEFQKKVAAFDEIDLMKI